MAEAVRTAIPTGDNETDQSKTCASHQLEFLAGCLVCLEYICPKCLSDPPACKPPGEHVLLGIEEFIENFTAEREINQQSLLEINHKCDIFEDEDRTATEELRTEGLPIMAKTLPTTIPTGDKETDQPNKCGSHQLYFKTACLVCLKHFCPECSSDSPACYSEGEHVLLGIEEFIENFTAEREINQQSVLEINHKCDIFEDEDRNATEELRTEGPPIIAHALPTTIPTGDKETDQPNKCESHQLYFKTACLVCQKHFCPECSSDSPACYSEGEHALLDIEELFENFKAEQEINHRFMLHKCDMPEDEDRTAPEELRAEDLSMMAKVLPRTIPTGDNETDQSIKCEFHHLDCKTACIVCLKFFCRVCLNDPPTCISWGEHEFLGVEEIIENFKAEWEITHQSSLQKCDKLEDEDRTASKKLQSGKKESQEAVSWTAKLPKFLKPFLWTGAEWLLCQLVQRYLGLDATSFSKWLQDKTGKTLTNLAVGNILRIISELDAIRQSTTSPEVALKRLGTAILEHNAVMVSRIMAPKTDGTARGESGQNWGQKSINFLYQLWQVSKVMNGK